MARTITCLFLVSVFVAVVSSITVVHFENKCNKTLTIPTMGTMSLLYSGQNPTNKTCIVSVQNQDKNNQTMVLAYLKQNDIDCKHAKMEIFDERGTDAAKSKTGPNGTCQFDSDYVYNSTQQFMTFKFNDNNSKSRFELIVTSVHQGKCHSDELDCGNKYCINDDLICNSYNNCGNHFDEATCVAAVVLALWAIVVIIVCCAMVVSCISIVVYFCFCRRRSKRMQYRQI